MRWDIDTNKMNPSNTEPKYKNPLFKKENLSLNNFNFEIIRYFILFIILLILYFIFYSPLFSIKEIEFLNLQNISPINITEKYIKPQLNSYNFLLTRQNNLFSFNKSGLINSITEEYGLESINVDKKLPNKIVITINEKIPTIIYQSSGLNFYLDENGIITKRLNEDESINSNNMPLIINLSEEITNIRQELFTKEKFKNIEAIINYTKDYKKINIKNYEIPVLLSTQFNILTEEGYKIYFDTTKDAEEQFNRLQRVLDESASGENPTEYIDLRIGERVYIK